MSMSTAQLEAVATRAALGRVAEPRELAGAALLLARVELTMKVEPGLRNCTPLLCRSMDGSPMRQREADSWLRALMLLAFVYAKAGRHSFHSFRIGCACALRRLGHDDQYILRYCRWKSLDSLRVYARVGRHDFSTAVGRIASQTLDTLQACNLPRISVVEAITTTLWEDGFESSVPELDADRLAAGLLDATTTDAQA